MILVYRYVIKTKIPVQLYVGFEFLNDLYLSFAGYLFFLLLIVFNIITIICIVSEIINLKNKNTDNSSVKRIIIIPLVFIFCFQLVGAIPAATQKVKNFSDVNLSFDDEYSGVISDLDSYYICVDNPIAKAGYLEKYYIDNNQNSIKIDLKMTTIDKTYPMEEICNNQITNFLQRKIYSLL